MADPALRRATYSDLLETPEHQVAEIVHGVLYQSPRPAVPHSIAASAIGEELGPPFKRGRGGPGGWMILYEPEIHLGEHVVVPDLGGWRRQRLPEAPAAPYLTLSPDWVCEVLSPSTRALDRGAKLAVYAEFAVPYVWLVEPLEQLLEILILDHGRYKIQQAVVGQTRARLEPFDALELDIGIFWQR